MKEHELAEEFSKILPGLLEYTKKACNLFGDSIDPHDYIAECYLHIWNNREKIKGIPIEAVAKNWTRMNMTWKNSPIKVKFRESNLVLPGEDLRESQNLPDIEALIHEFTRGLSPYNRGLWRVYWDKGITKGQEMADHLGISRSSAYLLLRECKALEAQLRIHITKHI